MGIHCLRALDTPYSSIPGCTIESLSDAGLMSGQASGGSFYGFLFFFLREER